MLNILSASKPLLPQRPLVLLVDDDADVLQASTLALQAGPWRLASALDPQAAQAELAQQDVAVLLLDLNFRRGASDGSEGLALLRQLKRQQPQAVIVVVTAHAGVQLAVQAMQLGASDFVAKPWSNERLFATVQNALELHLTRQAAQRAMQQAAELGQPAAAAAAHGLIGHSPALAHVRALIEAAAPSEANVLILGENGTGKELVAMALHRASRRANAPMVALDMGALPGQLVDSELFGHRKGAFTDARSDRVGRIAAANGGTLFMDEIGNLPLALQPKLLAVLERRQVVPLGSNTALAVDVRFISATNLSRDALADEAQFRPDLLWRLNTVEIHVPPLRQRREDIALLAQHFASHYSRKYHKPERPFSSTALQAMADHPWPGNVRALRHAVERAVVMASGPSLTPQDLALAEGAALPARRTGQGAAAAGERALVVAKSEDLNLDRAERQLVERALAKHAWNISLAAKELGLTRASLYRRMQRHGL